MKARKTIGGIMAVAGLFVAVCTMNGCKYEMLIRGIGVAVFTVGAAIGGWFDFQEGGRNEMD